MLKNKNGFTLVEIMVVVAIIVIIFTLAVPIMLRSRMNANEVAAIGHCRLIANACQSYYTNVQPHTYPASIAVLTTLTPPYLDQSFNAAAPQRQGYIFTYGRTSADSFWVRARPRSVGRTGNRYFYVDETGVIRARTGGPAGPTDPPVSG